MSIRLVTPEEAVSLLEQAKDDLKALAQTAKTESPRQAGMYMIKRAREAAPVKTGHLVQNIIGMPSGRGYTVISSVQGGWPYNMWINMGPQQITSWGRTYPQTNHTGKPGYFDWARNLTQQKFKSIVADKVKHYKIIR